MRVLVTGAGGMLGQDVMRAAEGRHDPVGLGHAELDITDADALRRTVATVRPDVILNCAAYTNVDGAESDEAAAMRGNAEGPRLLAEAAAETGALVVYPSSDYVFDGMKPEPYVESDPTGPRSAYGRSKLAGEQATAAATSRHLIVRSSWLFGMGGKNFVATMLRLAGERDEVAVVDDQRGCPTYTAHLAEGLLELIERDETGVHHLAGSGSCSWFDLARATFEDAGVGCRVRAIPSTELQRPAPRPAQSALVSERPDPVTLPDWREGLRAYLSARVTA